MKLPDLPPVSGLSGKGNTPNTDCTRRGPGGFCSGQGFDSPRLHQNQKRVPHAQTGKSFGLNCAWGTRFFMSVLLCAPTTYTHRGCRNGIFLVTSLKSTHDLHAHVGAPCGCILQAKVLISDCFDTKW